MMKTEKDFGIKDLGIPKKTVEILNLMQCKTIGELADMYDEFDEELKRFSMTADGLEGIHKDMVIEFEWNALRGVFRANLYLWSLYELKRFNEELAVKYFNRTSNLYDRVKLFQNIYKPYFDGRRERESRKEVHGKPGGSKRRRVLEDLRES